MNVIKRLCALSLVGMLLVACSSSAKLGNDTKDDVLLQVTNYNNDINETTGEEEGVLTFDITNHSTKAIMMVDYELSFKDKDGNEIGTLTDSYFGADAPIQPEETRIEIYKLGELIDPNVAQIDVTITSVKDDQEVAPIHLPQAGESLYQALNSEHLQNMEVDTPVSITMWIDHGGPRDVYTVTDPAQVQDATNAFMKIKVGQETQEFVTDRYNGITFTFADGTQETLNLNGTNAEITAYNKQHLYKLDHLGPFMSAMEQGVMTNE